MTRRRTLCLLLSASLWFASHAWGRDGDPASWNVWVSIETPEGATVAARLTATAKDVASGEPMQAEVRRLEAPWQGSLELPEGTEWRLSAEADGYWSAGCLLKAGEDRAVLRLFPTGTVAGRPVFSEADQVAEEITVRFSAVPSTGDSMAPDIPESFLTCPVEEGKWACALPAAALDLRLEAPGFIPLYFWDVEPDPGKPVELGNLRLDRGASIVGWVEAPADVEEAGTTMEIEPRNAGWIGDPSARRRMGALSRKTKANDRGFFQFRGMPPGGYVLTARKTGLPPVQLFPIDVEPGKELVLGESVVLQPGSELLLAIEPPVDPRGVSWIVGLQRREPMTNILGLPDERPAHPDGTWEQKDLAVGEYFLSISDSEESVWLRDSIDLEPGRTFLPMPIPVVAIVGEITHGGEPVQATLVFGSTEGRRQVRISSDEDGVFEGYLPEEGSWPVEILLDEEGLQVQALDTVEVHVPDGQEVARIEIKLHDTRLTGQVVDENGPVEDAVVMAIRSGKKRRREAIVASDANGEFELLGPEPGTIKVQAQKRERSTALHEVEIVEGQETTLLLTLEGHVSLSGYVRFAGMPFAGARIVAFPRGAESTAEQAVSEVDGFFELRLPASAVAADVLVIPPGFDMQIFRTPISQEQPPLTIDLENSRSALLLRTERGSLKGVLDADLIHRGASLPIRALIAMLNVTSRFEMAEGRIGLRGLQSGDYQVCAPDLPCQGVFLNPSDEVTVILPAANSNRTEKERI